MPLQLGGPETERPQTVTFDPDNAAQVQEAVARRKLLEARGFQLAEKRPGEFRLNPPPRGPNIGVFRVISQNGDDRICWDRTNAAQVKEAYARFKEFLEKGYTAYALVAGKRSHKLTEFNPALEEVLFVPGTRPG